MEQGVKACIEFNELTEVVMATISNNTDHQVTLIIKDKDKGWQLQKGVAGLVISVQLDGKLSMKYKQFNYTSKLTTIQVFHNIKLNSFDVDFNKAEYDELRQSLTNDLIINRIIINTLASTSDPVLVDIAKDS